MSGTGSDFVILEYNFNSSHSSEEFMLHLKKQKKRLSPFMYPERSWSGQRVLITSGEGEVEPQDWQLGKDLAKELKKINLIRKVYHL